MRPPLDRLNSASTFPVAMTAFLWPLSKAGGDRTMVNAALLLTVVAGVSLYFEFIHKPRDSYYRD